MLQRRKNLGTMRRRLRCSHCILEIGKDKKGVLGRKGPLWKKGGGEVGGETGAMAALLSNVCNNGGWVPAWIWKGENTEGLAAAGRTKMS